MPGQTPFIPKMYQSYYTMDHRGTIENRLNEFTKQDLFNIINGLCYHTEGECEADRHRIIKVIDDYILNTKQFIESIRNTQVKKSG